MKPDEVAPDTNIPATEKHALEETRLAETTDELIEKVIGRVKDFKATSHAAEPECVRVLESLKKLKPPATPDEPEPDSRVGDQIDEYRLIRLIGRGGMGEVYYAEHSRLGRGFALKVLHPDRLDDDQLIARFEREMKAIGRLDHENIVKATGAGRIGNDLFLVMEYVDGEPLSELLTSAPDGRLSIPEACRAIRDTCAGLQYVHDRGIIHRDIKPANLIQDQTGRVRILDLGLARIASTAKPDDELTREQQIMGTIDYMAPEQLRDSRQVDHRSDIYALGATFYKLLTGRTPFADDSHPTTESRLLAIANEEAPSILDLQPDVPPALGSLIQRMLARDPGDRPQSMSAVAEELDRLNSIHADSDSDPRLPKMSTSKMGTVLRQTSWIAAAILFIGFLVAAQIVIRLRTQDQGELLITAADDVEVTIRSSDGKEHTLKLAAGKDKTIEVRTGEFEIFFTGADADQFKWRSDQTELVMKKGDLFRASIVRKPAVTAIASQPARDDQQASPFDELQRRDIDPYELAIAGGGDATQAAAELVAIFGESRWKHGVVVNDVAFTKDGRRLLSAGRDQTILWDVASGKAVRQFPNSQTATINADNSLIATGDKWSTNGIEVWDANTGQMVRSLGSTANRPVWLLFGGNDTLISVEFEGEIEFWNFATGEHPRKSLDHGSQVVATAVSQDGTLLATAGTDNAIRIWDLTKPTLVHTLSEAGSVLCVEFAPDGQTLLCGGNGFLDRWQLDASIKRQRLEEKFYSHSFRYSPDGQQLAVAQEDGVQIRDAKTNKVLSTLVGHARSVMSVAFSPDGKLLASAEIDNTVKVWETQSAKLISSNAERTGHAECVAVAADGKTLAMGFGDGFIEVVDVATAVTNHALKAGQQQVNSVDFNPNGKMIATCANSGEISLWDRVSGQALHRWRADAYHVFEVRFSPDGQSLASCGNEGIRIWDVPSARQLAKIPANDVAPRALAYFPDGKSLASVDESNRLAIWDTKTGELLRSRQLPAGTCRSVSISPDSRTIGCGSGHRVFLCDADGLKEPSGSLRYPDAIRVTSLSFSPNSTALVSAATDGTVRLWSRSAKVSAQGPIEYLAWKTILVQPGATIHQVVVTADGRNAVTANGNGTVSVFRLDHSDR